jgi:hypothetical protein
MKNLITLIIYCFSMIIFSQKIGSKVTYVVSMESYSKEKIDSISKKLNSQNEKM